MLSGKCEDIDSLIYPIYCTPKLDGIRCLKINGKAVSRKFKPIPNKFTAKWIEHYFPDNVDGELILLGKSSIALSISEYS